MKDEVLSYKEITESAEIFIRQEMEKSRALNPSSKYHILSAKIAYSIWIRLTTEYRCKEDSARLLAVILNPKSEI